MFDWQQYFRGDYEEIGAFISKQGFRISVHPDQFTLINSPAEEIFERSKKELQYHAQLLDAMNLDLSAKIQIHVGGAYGDKTRSIQTFIDRYATLHQSIKSRLVIENDERLYDANDCLSISQKTGIPVLFDVFHHKINHRIDSVEDCFALVTETWNPQKDGVPMVDYSSQKPAGRIGQHAETIDTKDFGAFLASTLPFDYDVMLEIKDKEVSAQKALQIAMENQRIKR
jgi:UV DNA damage endonuclease